MFKVGMKVVCIDIKNVDYDILEWMPAIGEIYTIVGLHPYPSGMYLRFPESELDVFASIYFRPLDYAFVEEVIKQVKPEKIEA